MMHRRYTRREVMGMLVAGGGVLLAACTPSDTESQAGVSVRKTSVPTPKGDTATPWPNTPTPEGTLGQPRGITPTHASATGTAEATATATLPPTPSATATLPPTPSATETLSPTPSATATLPPTPSATATPAGWQPPTQIRITPNEDFYTMKYNPSAPPEVDLNEYRLVIEGEVDNPLSLSLEELKAYPGITQMRTLQCIGNPIGGDLIGNAEWVGLSLAKLLKDAGIRPRGRFLKLESLDGYHTGIPRALALDEDSLLAYEMNGERLPAKHGYPLRCLFPGRYGQKQPKWITRITAQSKAHVGHWEGQEWDDDAFIQPGSIIELPRDGATIDPDFVISGIAITNESGLEKLEVSIDNGVKWQPAELLRAATPYAWTMWWLKIEGAQSGTYRILAKATDGTGHRQARKKKLQIFNVTFPFGSDYMHEVSATVTS